MSDKNIEENQSEEETLKKRTVKEIIDQVLNCTVVHEQKPVAESNSKLVTVKEILGEILEYNVCKPSPAYPSTSTDEKPATKTRSEANISTRDDKDALEPYRPCGIQIYSSSMISEQTLKTDALLPVTVNRLLPSYSSVIRQGPQPHIKSAESFVPKMPPPSYAEVEGLWDDVPSAVSSDSVLFGPDPLYLICPICRIIVMTEVERERTAITHWIALILCIFLCWPCCLLPYYMKSCSYSYHSCPNCGHYFGMYNPF